MGGNAEGGSDSATAAAARRWSFGPAVLDERAMELSVDGAVVHVERKPLEVLLFLLHHAGEVVTKDEILDAVWPGRILSDTVLTKAIGRIREALGDESQEIIRTQHGFGYRLAAAVHVEASATPPPPRFDFKAGDSPPLRPRWQLVERLGVGGHGEAWLGRHEKTREARVYKFALDSAALGSLKREITIYRLLHDALPERTDFVDLLDWNLEQPPCFIESEYAGLNLVQWAKKQGGLSGIPLPVRMEIAARIADALAAAHSVGILHKDLKPSNVLVPDGDAAGPRIKLADFGSGGVLDPERLAALGITRLGFTKAVKGEPTTSGTPVYFAPEVIAGQPFSVKADVYALSVMVFQLAAGDLSATLAPGWEQRIDDELLREDIALAAAGDPNQRLADASQLAQRLRTLESRKRQRAAELAAQADVERARAALGRVRKRRRWTLASISVLSLVTVIVGALYLSAESARRDAQQAADTTQAVVAFLTQDLLSVSDPLTGATRPNLTVREVLDHAAERVDKRFDSRPEVAAQVHIALSWAWSTLGDRDAARRAAERSAALRVGTEGPIADWQAVAMFSKTVVLSRGSRMSRETCDVAAEIGRRGVEGTRFPELLPSIRAVAAMCQAVFDDPEAARVELEKILDEARRSDLPDQSRHNVMSMSENGLSAIAVMAGDYATAEQHARRNYELSVLVHGAQSDQTLAAALNHVDAMSLLGRVEEAERELRALETDAPSEERQAALGGMWPKLRYEQGRMDEAAALQVEHINSRRAESSDETAQVYASLFLGVIRHRQNDFERAVTVLRNALARYEAVYGANPDPVRRRQWLEANAALADALRQTGRREDASAVLRSIPPWDLARLPAQAPARAEMRRVQGLLWLDEGETALALKALRDAVEMNERSFGPANWRTARSREDLARALR